MYVRVRFQEWQKDKKFPIGQIVDYLGNVGEETVEYEMLRYLHEVDFPSLKMDLSIKEEEEHGIIHHEVFSIDPLGSKDIDDAFSFEETETHYHIGIHIANPSLFVQDPKDIQKILEERICTVYMPHRCCNMLSNEISENRASLLEGKRRHTLSVLYQIRKEDLFIEYVVEERWVKNRKNYVYEDVDRMIKNKKWDSKDIRKMFDVSKLYFEMEEMDSHKFVEKWMIEANHDVAVHCTYNFGEKTILRVCPEIPHSKLDQMDSILKEYIKRGEMKGAEYQYYQEDTNQSHRVLGLTCYTHFTSPIRRGIDFYIHLLLRGFTDITIDLSKVNERMKKMRRLDRDLRRMQFLFQYAKKDYMESEGYVVDLSKNSMRIYIPEYHLEEKVNLKDQMGYSEVEGKEVETFSLYEKVKVKLFIFVREEYFRNKIRILISKF
jgi:ribonuclease R